MFVTSKVSPYDLGYEKCLESVKVQPRSHTSCLSHARHHVTAGHQRSVAHLRVPRLNLALLHWPAAARIPPNDPRNAQLRLDSWRALVVAQGMGLVGVTRRPASLSSYTC